MSTRLFEIVLDPQPEGGYCVHVPDLPDVVTEGESRSEAISMAREAITLYLEGVQEQGWDLHEAERINVQIAA